MAMGGAGVFAPRRSFLARIKERGKIFWNDQKSGANFLEQQDIKWGKFPIRKVKDLISFSSLSLLSQVFTFSLIKIITSIIEVYMPCF